MGYTGVIITYLLNLEKPNDSLVLNGGPGPFLGGFFHPTIEDKPVPGRYIYIHLYEEV